MSINYETTANPAAWTAVHQPALERYAEAHQYDDIPLPLPADLEYAVGTDRTITGAQVNDQLLGVDLEAEATEQDRAELAYQLTDDYLEDAFEAHMEEGWAQSWADDLGMSVDDLYAQPDSYVFNVDMARDMAQEQDGRGAESWTQGDDAATWSASYEAAEQEMQDYYDTVADRGGDEAQL